MKTSQHGVDFIKRFEGLELEAYQDAAGVWTIGYGHTETAEPGMRITEAKAEDLLRRDLDSRERALQGWAVVNGVLLNQNEFDALSSFIFNVGVGAFRGSTAAKRLIDGDRDGAAQALTWWNKARVGGKLQVVRGLTRRRAAEQALFLAPMEDSAADSNPTEANVRPDGCCDGLVAAIACFILELIGGRS